MYVFTKHKILNLDVRKKFAPCLGNLYYLMKNIKQVAGVYRI